MASIVDVAKKANVSVATVSRILNRERNVAPATARLVEEAMKELGYVPRAVRPGPKPKRRQGVHTGSIAFLAVGSYSPAEMYSMPAFPILLSGIQRGIERHGMELVLAHLPEGKIVPPVLARRRADGVLLFGHGPFSDALTQALHRVPGVWCFHEQEELCGIPDCVLYDNSHVGQIAAEYLLERGHRHLAFVSSNPSHEAFAERRDLFVRTATAKCAAPAVIERDFLTDQKVQGAEQLTEELLGLDPRPTGVCFASDDVMLTVYNRLCQRGIRPGTDLDLIGCNNDTQYMEQMHPRPATVDIKLDVVGERAVEQLLWRMSHPADENQTVILVKPELVPAGPVSTITAQPEIRPDRLGAPLSS